MRRKADVPKWAIEIKNAIEKAGVDSGIGSLDFSLLPTKQVATIGFKLLFSLMKSLRPDLVRAVLDEKSGLLSRMPKRSADEAIRLLAEHATPSFKREIVLSVAHQLGIDPPDVSFEAQPDAVFAERAWKRAKAKKKTAKRKGGAR